MNESELGICFDLLNADHKCGVMIDAGAYNGDTLQRFALAGWEIYAFEPEPGIYEQLKVNFQDYDNVHIDHHALADIRFTGAPFYRIPDRIGFDSLGAFKPEHVLHARVDVDTLANLLPAELEQVDFVKIDTEGFDLMVLRGFPWERFTPEVICVEYTDERTPHFGYSTEDLANFLIGAGYMVIYSDYWGNNKLMGYAEHPFSRTYSAWGNIIAVKPEYYSRLLVLAEIC